MINARRVTFANRAWGVVLATTLVVTVWVSAVPAEARVLDRQRYSFTSVGHERTCGRHLTVETTMSGIQMTKARAGGLHYTLYDNYNIHEVLTDVAGEGYIIDQNGLYTEIRVRHARGTLYRYTAINTGQVFTIRTLGGKAVERNHGLEEITFIVDTLGDSDPSNDVYLENTLRLVRDVGSHPLITQTKAEFCAVIEQAIQG